MIKILSKFLNLLITIFKNDNYKLFLTITNKTVTFFNVVKV